MEKTGYSEFNDEILGIDENGEEIEARYFIYKPPLNASQDIEEPFTQSFKFNPKGLSFKNKFNKLSKKKKIQRGKHGSIKRMKIIDHDIYWRFGNRG